MGTMKIKTVLLTLACLAPLVAFPQVFSFSGEYATEWEWDMNKSVNWVNLLRLDASLRPWRNGSLDVATIHVARTKDYILDDYQVFSNIYEENLAAAIAVLGYMHTWEDRVHLFFGVRNMNEDFFVSDCLSLFTNSSPGIFPTIGASYDIANYPVSALTVYFDVTWRGWTLRNSFYNGVGHNGWNKHDNPFVFRPGKDGVFNVTELSYEWDRGSYYAGVAVHSKRFRNVVGFTDAGGFGLDASGVFREVDGVLRPIDPDDVDAGGEYVDANGMPVSVDEDFVPESSKASCAWYVYGEQCVYEGGDHKVSIVAGYSENSDSGNECRRYALLGGTWEFGDNALGLSGQYADFLEGKEWTCELTWSHDFNGHLSLQPSVQFIHNGNGNFTPVLARLTYGF